jgi:hypothetical protein
MRRVIVDKWIMIENELPMVGDKVLIHHTAMIKEFSINYSRLKDGSDRTDEELNRREFARIHHEKNPIKIAYLYQATFSKKWMVCSNSDSSQGFICDLELVNGWMPLPEPPKS